MTPEEIRKLEQERGTLLKSCRDILDKAVDDKGEKRNLTAEEQGEYDPMWERYADLGQQIQREKLIAEEERKIKKPTTPPATIEPGTKEPGDTRAIRDTDEYRTTFSNYCLRGAHGLPLDEYRALQADDDEAGGYIVPPEQFVNELIKDLDDIVFIRAWARKFTVREAKSLGAPSRQAKLSSFAWSTEIQAPTADTALKFGKRNLYPHPLTGAILVSRDLLNSATMSPEAIVRDEMSRDAGEVQEDAFLTGSGAGQPLGLFTASSDGISTARDISTGNQTTEVRFDGLTEAKWSLKLGYWQKARWMFHRNVAKQIAKLKDGEGQYLWRESVRVGEPETLMGRPVFISERSPSTMTTGLYVGILGDFEQFWIADALNIEIQRLIELKAETNQVEFIGRLKMDAMPVKEEAFSRVTLA